ncbi:MAG: sterol desaturase family protein [Proteobacteria bacterium]|nr:sterol desaturase family protein [Pseudomonadota bacterium]
MERKLLKNNLLGTSCLAENNLNIDDSGFGTRDHRDHYSPNKRVTYPPIFTWPAQPIATLKWFFGFPGYFLPWNTFYVVIGMISWYWLSPPLEKMATPTLSLFMLIFFRNTILVTAYYGIFHLRLYIQRQQGTCFKFNPSWTSVNNKKFLFKNQTTDNLILTFSCGVTIWAGLEVGMLWLAANSFINIISVSEHPIYFMFVVLTIHLWRDFHFYLIHRLIHWGPLYRFVHHVHHKNNNPGPWSGLAMHPVEHLLYFSCALIYLLLPFHPAFAVICLAHAGLSPAPGHSGFERITVDKNRSVDIDGYAHYLHHKYFECNYADGILPLDKWFGSFHDGSPESNERMKKRLIEKSLKRPL